MNKSSSNSTKRKKIGCTNLIPILVFLEGLRIYSMLPNSIIACGNLYELGTFQMHLGGGGEARGHELEALDLDLVCFGLRYSLVAINKFPFLLTHD